MPEGESLWLESQNAACRALIDAVPADERRHWDALGVLTPDAAAASGFPVRSCVCLYARIGPRYWTRRLHPDFLKKGRRDYAARIIGARLLDFRLAPE